MSDIPLHILCISRFYKGQAFLESVHKQGHLVFLLTSSKLRNEDWPWESITDTYYMDEDAEGRWSMDHVIGGLAYFMRTIKFDALVALDDYDVEKVAHLREHFRIPGMGETTSRYFRDKLAMRIKAQEDGLPVPSFTALFNDNEINEYLKKVKGPYMIKPRSAASAFGISKVNNAEEVWSKLNELGNNRHGYLMEKFAPGDVYHVDGLIHFSEIKFSRASQYLDTPFAISHGGGIFRSVTVPFASKDDKELRKLNEKVVASFGLKHGAFHSEYIKCKEDGKYYFLETSSRVGGANLAEMVEASSGINLWAEWAKIELAVLQKIDYSPPKAEKNYGGIVVSLSRYLHPDYKPFNDKEICWKMERDWHIGIIVKSKEQERILSLLDNYTKIISEEYHASLPPKNTHYNP